MQGVVKHQDQSWLSLVPVNPTWKKSVLISRTKTAESLISSQQAANCQLSRLLLFPFIVSLRGAACVETGSVRAYLGKNWRLAPVFPLFWNKYAHLAVVHHVLQDRGDVINRLQVQSRFIVGSSVQEFMCPMWSIAIKKKSLYVHLEENAKKCSQFLWVFDFVCEYLKLSFLFLFAAGDLPSWVRRLRVSDVFLFIHVCKILNFLYKCIVFVLYEKYQSRGAPHLYFLHS